VAIVAPVFEMAGGQIQAVSTGVGNGGTIEVQAGRVMLSGAAQLDSSARGTGRGGTVSVTATDTLSLADNAAIDVHGSGGGTVVIRGSTLLVDHALISAETAGDVNGAGIDIAVAEAVHLAPGGTISTTSSGAGKAGDVRITAGSVQMAGAMLAAEAFGEGRAGDIVMHVGTLTLTPGSKISSTTTGIGQGGISW
jgi:large exoprotein involved in heme utilization and adhesion